MAWDFHVTAFHHCEFATQAEVNLDRRVLRIHLLGQGDPRVLSRDVVEVATDNARFWVVFTLKTSG